ncbi:MAG TPA: substrate-binding domain-containing protein [Candidatus Sulfotelmatobacter sp.]
MGVKSAATLLLLGLAICCVAPRAMGQDHDVAVIVNSANPATNISLGDLRKILAGVKRSWPGGQPIKVVTRGPGCLERLVLLKLLAMSESEYKQYWTAEVFRGEADAEPLAVPSVGMQKEALTALPWAISLVGVQNVKPGMKVIKVNGLLPGAAGYPLH